jgi:Mg2+-importing ATPase
MIRTEKIAFVQSTASTPVLMLTGIVMAIGCYLPFSAMAATMKMAPLPLGYWPFLAATVTCYCLLTQIGKQLYIRKFHEWM